MTESLDDLKTVNQIVEKHPAFTVGGLRSWIFKADENGLSTCIARIGRKVLIDEVLFLEWINNQNKGDK